MGAFALLAQEAEELELQRDLDGGLPEGEWDLVAAAHPHSPVDLSREKVLQRAAGAVAPGSTLLVIGHQGHPSWHEQPAEVTFPTADDVLVSRDLRGWTVERPEEVEVAMTAPGGSRAPGPTNAVRLRRRSTQVSRHP